MSEANQHEPDTLGGDVCEALRSDPSIGVCVIDESGVILSANERIAQRAGLELSDARLKRTHEPTDPD